MVTGSLARRYARAILSIGSAGAIAGIGTAGESGGGGARAVGTALAVAGLIGALTER